MGTQPLERRWGRSYRLSAGDRDSKAPRKLAPGRSRGASYATGPLAASSFVCSVKLVHWAVTSASAKMASAGHMLTQAPQSMRSFGYLWDRGADSGEPHS